MSHLFGLLVWLVIVGAVAAVFFRWSGGRQFLSAAARGAKLIPAGPTRVCRTCTQQQAQAEAKMLDHLLNVSYLLYALTLIVINPIFTGVFAAVLYMRGEMAAINAVFVQGFTSLGAISVYIIPLAMIGGLISYIVSDKTRKQDD